MSELKGAVEDGQLSLHFQPKLNIRARSLYGVECLVRWIHPVHGLSRRTSLSPWPSRPATSAPGRNRAWS
ncbi:EAL domain-containing protein [Pseudomonas sp. EA_35y_Pfl2_R5]|uniref:EAL domain-containing protein n=1 Tax=Pseudomonas sp. EA_35y_Pfl2_R5 TaxID=3088690 RepID=UPI00403F2985